MSTLPENGPVLQASRMLTCVLPDDGTDKELLRVLRSEKGIIRASSASCLGSAILADARTRPGRLPQPYLVRMVKVVVAEEEVEALFEYMYEKARIGRPGGGVILLGAPIHSTAYALPEGVPDEK